jgi:hypothetical protein
MLKIKVPMAFLGTQGFSAHREGRYLLFFPARRVFRYIRMDVTRLIA